MKTIKISLALIVMVAIVSFVIWSYLSTDKVGAVSASQNQFTAKIEQEIIELTHKPDNEFSKDYYNEVAYHIDDYHKNERLGSNQSENDQQKENFSQTLYSAYIDKFIKQAFNVFNGTIWDPKDLQFIRSEYQTLRKSPRLEAGSSVDTEFAKMQAIFSKYDEISGFIASSKGFSYADLDLSARFPISDAKSIISSATTYRNSRLGNEYVNNCARLHRELEEISKTMFDAHVSYLDNKISYWSDLYSNYNSQKAYADNLYTPLRNEIQVLDNGIYYKTSDFDGEYKRLTAKWEADGIKAYNYFNNR